MGMRKCTLTHPSINSGNPVTVLAPRIQPSGKKNLTHKPDANGGDIVEVQTQSYENMGYQFSSVFVPDNPDGAEHTLDVEDLQVLYTTKYDSTNPIEVSIEFANHTRTESVALKGTDGASPIKMVLSELSISFDTSRSDDTYLPTASFTLVETK